MTPETGSMMARTPTPTPSTCSRGHAGIHQGRVDKLDQLIDDRRPRFGRRSRDVRRSDDRALQIGDHRILRQPANIESDDIVRRVRERQQLGRAPLDERQPWLDGDQLALDQRSGEPADLAGTRLQPLGNLRSSDHAVVANDAQNVELTRRFGQIGTWVLSALALPTDGSSMARKQVVNLWTICVPLLLPCFLL